MKLIKIIALLPCLVITLVLTQIQAGAAVTFTNLVSFNRTNGANPEAELIQGKDGNFYGTTFQGGLGLTNGILFKMTPAGDLTTLVSFNGANGALPRSGLVQDSNGNLYGTTFYSTSYQSGTVFKATTNGILTTLVAFAETNGALPIGSLIEGQDGDFYGTSAYGGTNQNSPGGTVFQVTPTGSLTTLVSFDSNDHTGFSPYTGLVQGSDGSLYGTTYQGGANHLGTIFRVTTNGTFTSLYSFKGTADGSNPYGKLVQGPNGDFYGTTFLGGTNALGTVFKFSTNGVLTSLISFNKSNGAKPQAGLLLASDGNFYGTTSAGGAYTNQYDQGYGTVFEMTTNGVLTTLISFNGMNGALPEAGLMQAADGSLYGTTYGATIPGAVTNYGTIFKITLTVPPPEFISITRAGTTVTMTWKAAVGQNYQMLYKTNLSQTAWSNLNNSLTATNPIMTTLDTIGPDHQRFYRILMLP